MTIADKIERINGMLDSIDSITAGRTDWNELTKEELINIAKIFQATNTKEVELIVDLQKELLKK